MPRRSRGRRNLARVESRINALSNSTKGFEMVLPNHPPPITQVPWNNVVLSISLATDTTETVVHVSDLITQITDQLGVQPDSKNGFLIRVHWVKMWALGNYSISADFFDLNKDTDQYYIKTIENWPARNQYARVGYSWPISMTERVLHIKETEVCSVFSSADGKVLLHIYVSWRMPYSNVPRFRNSFTMLELNKDDE